MPWDGLVYVAKELGKFVTNAGSRSIAAKQRNDNVNANNADKAASAFMGLARLNGKARNEPVIQCCDRITKEAKEANETEAMGDPSKTQTIVITGDTLIAGQLRSYASRAPRRLLVVSPIRNAMKPQLLACALQSFMETGAEAEIFFMGCEYLNLDDITN